MKKYLIYSLLFLASCSAPTSREANVIPSTAHSTSLDSILGDKIKDVDQKLIRPNNFNQLKGLSVKDLKLESSLYSVTPINKNYYLLKQKKQYSEARHFNIILKTQKGTVVDFYVSNDFSIKDCKITGTTISILCDDWDNKNIYWKGKQQVKVLQLDTDFQEIWNYEVDSNSPLQADKIISNSRAIVVKIHVITGCHICYSIVELELNNNGIAKSVKEVNLHNSKSISIEKLKEFFAL